MNFYERDDCDHRRPSNVLGILVLLVVVGICCVGPALGYLAENGMNGKSNIFRLIRLIS